MNLLDLFVKVSIDDQATPNIGTLSNSITETLATAAKTGAVAITAVTAAVTAFSGAMVSAVKDVAAYGDEIDKNSQKMGLSAEAYQEWDSVLRHSGSSMESMKTSMKTLANAAETGNEAFQKIGLTQEQIASMSQEELFEATITGLQNVADTTERTYLSSQLLGRGATELGALLNTSAEDTQAMRDRVHELGGVMSDEAVKASAAFQDSLQDLNTAFDGLKNRLVGEFLPAATQVSDGLTEIFAGNYEEGAAIIEEGIDGIIDKAIEMLPKVIEVGGRIIGALVEALVTNLPDLIDTFLSGLTDMIDSFADNTDAFVEAAGNFIMGIGTAIAKNAPALLVALGKLILNLVASIITHIPDMLVAAVEFFGTLFQAIGEATLDVLSAVAEMLGNVITSIGNFVGEMFEAGVNFIGGFLQGLWEGIVSIPGMLIDGVGSAIDSFLDFLGIASPSKLMARYGRFTMQGLAEGIEDAMPEVSDAMADVMGLFDEQPTISADIGATAKSRAATASGEYGAGVSLSVYVTASPEDDPDDLGRRIGEAAAYELRMQGVAA